MTESKERTDGRPKRLSIVVFSGDYDKVMAAMNIATAARSMGASVTLFFTFWGLNAIRKAQVASGPRDIIQMLFGFLNRPGVSKLPLSRLNFMGLGRRLLGLEMRSKKIPTLEELVQAAKSMGVKMVACTMSMAVMGISEKDFIEGIDEFAGAATYFQTASESDVNLFV